MKFKLTVLLLSLLSISTAQSGDDEEPAHYSPYGAPATIIHVHNSGAPTTERGNGSRAVPKPLPKKPKNKEEEKKRALADVLNDGCRPLSEEEIQRDIEKQKIRMGRTLGGFLFTHCLDSKPIFLHPWFIREWRFKKAVGPEIKNLADLTATSLSEASGIYFSLPIDAKGNTALHESVSRQKVRLTALLINAGVRPGIKNLDNKTPEDVLQASENRGQKYDIVRRYLQEAQAHYARQRRAQAQQHHHRRSHSQSDASRSRDAYDQASHYSPVQARPVESSYSPLQATADHYETAVAPASSAPRTYLRRPGTPGRHARTYSSRARSKRDDDGDEYIDIPLGDEEPASGPLPRTMHPSQGVYESFGHLATAPPPTPNPSSQSVHY